MDALQRNSLTQSSSNEDALAVYMPFPGALSLVAAGPEPLPSFLALYGFAYDEALKRFRCDALEFAGYTGAVMLTALGREEGDRGRRMSPERLRSGEPLEAVQFTLFFEDAPKSPLAGEAAAQLIQRMLVVDNLDVSDVFAEEIAPSSHNVPPSSCVGARCQLNGRAGVWGATIAGAIGFTCSCAYLDYFIERYERRGAVDSSCTTDELYDVIKNWGPWDVPIDDRLT